jgi:hypothetical protein
MAESDRHITPGEELPKEVYDVPSGTARSDPTPKLKEQEEGNFGEDSINGAKAEDDMPSRDELSEAEERSSAAYSEHEDQLGRGYRQTRTKGTKSSIRYALFGTGRRRVMSGGIAGSTVAIVIFILTITSGPLQFIHLSQILQKNFWAQEKVSSIRTKGLFRYAKTKDIGETRVGFLGSQRFAKATAQLKELGIEFTDRISATGAPRTMVIDTSKYPDYKKLSTAEKKAAIIRDFQVKDPTIISRRGNVFSIKLSSTSLKGIDFSSALLKTSLSKLDKGKLATAMNFRILKKFYNMPRLFSPLEKVTSAKQNQLGEVLTPKQAEEERSKQINKSVAETPEALKARSSVKELLENNKTRILTTALIGQTTICLIRSVADDSITFNRAAIILPATVQAVDKVSVGSQVQSGQNFNIGQLGGIAEGFKDSDGGTIWAAKSLQATAGEANPSGPDLPGDFGQAFSGKTTADNIRGSVEIHILGRDVTAAVCSQAGKLVGAVIGLGAIITGFIDFGGSWAAYVAQQAAVAAATAGVLYFFQQEFSNIIQDKAIVPDVLSGPLGGNLLAYGAREASNVGARASGGVELDGTENTVVDKQQKLEDESKFRSLSVSSRLFNIHDSRSSISRLIDRINPDPMQQVAGLGTGFANFLTTIPHSLASVFPKAQAAGATYRWGFPKYGIPQDIAEDPNYEDPYDNADRVATELDEQHCDIKSDCPARTRAMKCFGADINKDSGKWSVVAERDVNPGSRDYTGAHCAEGSNEWHRIMLFVFDSRLMDAVACYQEDVDSCSNLDMASSGPVTSDTSSISVSSEQLAQQILNNKNISYPLDSVSSNGSTKEVLQALANGSKAPVTCKDGSTQGVTSADMSPQILQFILDLGNQGKVGVNALTDKCHTAGSMHYQGKAVDFECEGVTFSTASADRLADKYGISRNSETCSANHHWHYSTSGS